jgi:predicted nucleic acid-binding protein
VTAIDTNVLIAYGASDLIASRMAAIALASATRPLCICGAVFSELLGSPGRNGSNLRVLFATIGISIEWEMQEGDWEAAGLAYQGYVHRRRSSGGGLPRRIATDFLIGAHAATRGYTLLTLDKRLYSVAFPTLRIESF